MRISTIAMFFYLGVSLVAISGCDSQGTPAAGIRIQTSYCYDGGGTSGPCPSGKRIVMPNIPISGAEFDDDYDSSGTDLTSGSVGTFGIEYYPYTPVTTNNQGFALISDGMSPAY
jgi:hypothetical protein